MKDIVELVERMVDGRFELSKRGPVIDELVLLAPEDFAPIVLRLKRFGVNSAGWRTLLFASVRSKEDLRSAIRWATDVRSSLREPETADLYLFLSEFELPSSEGVLVESDEHFCRKFVRRAAETMADLLSRSFLGGLKTGETGSALTDPLMLALESTASSFTWLTPEVRRRWKTAFETSVGLELLNELIDAVPKETDLE